MPAIKANGAEKIFPNENAIIETKRRAKPDDFGNFIERPPNSINSQDK